MSSLEGGLWQVEELLQFMKREQCAAVIVKHERWLADRHHLLRALDELRGRDLVCFCAPLACHGDLLARLANANRDERIVWWRSIKAAA